jgi:hypothetical protein
LNACLICLIEHEIAAIVYKGLETMAGGEAAIDFEKASVAREALVFCSQFILYIHILILGPINVSI